MFRAIKKKIISFLKKLIIEKINNLSNFSQAKYLLRLDDSCSTQKKEIWDEIEKILDKLGIKPIVAVIPFNKDKNLFIDPEDDNFWEKIKGWEKKGWEIALHGHSHVYHKVNKNDLVFPFYNRSEFACLDLKKQCTLMKESYEHFLKNNIKPNIWIAPSHTFDKNTLIALKNSTEIKYVSDGIALEPFKFMDLVFFPQQLWEPKKKLHGIWTICIHPNSMDKRSLSKFKEIISDQFFNGKFINTYQAKYYLKNFSIISYLYSYLFWKFRFFKVNIKKLIISKVRNNKQSV